MRNEKSLPLRRRRGAAALPIGDRRRARRRPGRWLILAACLLGPLGTNAAAAEEFPGFRTLPPGSGGWREVVRNVRSVVWIKRLESPDSSVSAAVLTGPAPTVFADRAAFAAFVRQSKTANPDPTRFEVALLRLEPAERPDAWCLRYENTLSDSGAVGEDGAPLKLRISGLACLHPGDRTRYFDVQFSYRGPPSLQLSGSDAAEGEAFLNSFEFTSPPADGRWALGPGDARPPVREAT